MLWLRIISTIGVSENPQDKSTKSAFVPVVAKNTYLSETITVEISFSSQVRLTLSLGENKLLDLIKELGNATAIIR